MIRDWRWGVRLLGRALIIIGLLMFGFVAYQLWGTGIETARYQNQLENEFEDLRAQGPDIDTSINSTSTTTPPTTGPSRPAPTSPDRATVPPTPPDTAAPPTTAPADVTPLRLGGALGKIEIPRIGLDFWIVGGVQSDDLKRGIGHYPETPMPGQRGNSALAGHRTTYGNPFYNIDDIEPGDEIIVTTVDGRFVYQATDQQIVSPSDYWVIATTQPEKATLTLTSCHPRFSSSQRIVINAELDRSGDAPIEESARQYAPEALRTPSPTTLPGDETETSAPQNVDPNGGGNGRPDGPDGQGQGQGGASGPGEGGQGGRDRAPDDFALSEGSADTFESSWFSDTSAFVDVALWTLVVVLITGFGYAVSWYLKRDWPGVVVVALPFLVALYFFYQNVNRLLPAAL